MLIEKKIGKIKIKKVDESLTVDLVSEINPGDLVQIWEKPESLSGRLRHGIAEKCLKVSLPFVINDEPDYRQQLYRLEKWKVWLVESEQHVIVQIRTIVNKNANFYSIIEEERIRKNFINDTFIKFNGVEVF